MKVESKTCCFFGHRKISNTDSLRESLYKIIEDLIMCNNVKTFLFGSKSTFDTLCREVVTKLKEKYPYIKRIYVIAEFPYIDDSYKAYLLENFEDTYFPECVKNAGKAAYIKRNREMIDHCDICIVYYLVGYTPTKQIKNPDILIDKSPRSGAGIAYEYAKRKNKMIINTAIY